MTHVDSSIRVASLCAGVGGLDLALSAAFGSRSVVYVERDAFAAAVLLARMENAQLEPAPIWCGDLGDVDWRPWVGRVDAVAAGFPCQPASVAGKRLGLDDERWLWPEVARAVRELRPRLVFLENVSGLLTVRGGVDAVLGDLAALGYAAEWDVFRAPDVGAPHKERERWFLVAYAHGAGLEGRSVLGGGRGDERVAGALRSEVAGAGSGACRCGDLCVSDDDRTGRGAVGLGGILDGEWTAWGRDPDGFDMPLFPPRPDDYDGWQLALSVDGTTQPALYGVVDGLAEGMDDCADRLRACGNGVVPLQAAVAFRVLAARAGLAL